MTSNIYDLNTGYSWILIQYEWQFQTSLRNTSKEYTFARKRHFCDDNFRNFKSRKKTASNLLKMENTLRAINFDGELFMPLKLSLKIRKTERQFTLLFHFFTRFSCTFLLSIKSLNTA